MRLDVVLLVLVILTISAAHGTLDRNTKGKSKKTITPGDAKLKVTSTSSSPVTRKVPRVETTTTQTVRQNLRATPYSTICSANLCRRCLKSQHPSNMCMKCCVRSPLVHNRVRRGLTKKQRDNIRKLRQKFEEAGKRLTMEKLTKRKGICHSAGSCNLL